MPKPNHPEPSPPSPQGMGCLKLWEMHRNYSKGKISQGEQPKRNLPRLSKVFLVTRGHASTKILNTPQHLKNVKFIKQNETQNLSVLTEKYWPRPWKAFFDAADAEWP